MLVNKACFWVSSRWQRQPAGYPLVVVESSHHLTVVLQHQRHSRLCVVSTVLCRSVASRKFCIISVSLHGNERAQEQLFHDRDIYFGDAHPDAIQCIHAPMSKHVLLWNVLYARVPAQRHCWPLLRRRQQPLPAAAPTTSAVPALPKQPSPYAHHAEQL